MSLEVKNLSFCYGKTCPIFQDLNFNIESGEIISILGPNGSGKTTLLKCLNRINEPSNGHVVFNGIDLKHLGMKEIACYMGYVPQEIRSSSSINVIDAVFMGRTPYANFKMCKNDRNIVFETIDLLNLNHLSFRMLNELSGGERQKVYLARALVQEPKILLLDEPTSNLDIRHQMETLEIIRKISTDKKMSVIMTMHDLNLAVRYSDNIILMKRGKFYTKGGIGKILDPGIISEIYDVEAEIYLDRKYPFVIPIGIKKDGRERI
jgi:iron complex transport system ATP-binding protein